MPAPKDILDLVERFQYNLAAYKSKGYNETQLRREFVDPFFKALGWDVENEGGLAEAYKQVVHEDSIKVGGLTKAPDYSFRIGGIRKFFLETKAPHKDLKQDPEPAYQVRRYAWSAKLPLSILTDFEEFAVYDCRIKPKQGDKASVARTIYIRYDEYADRWDDIAGLFSPDAIQKGAFDEYVSSHKKKRGTMEVDEAFLLEIERWREALAKNLALRNGGLGVRELNFAVQRTIDRIIFLRICEDRGIEPYGALQALENGTRVYRRLGELFQDADARYNSGIFHFKRERGRDAPPDELTLDLEIDDRILKDIIKSLYYPNPYEFSEIPGEILGQIYERFLGNVISLTPGHRAKVEEKPEVRKAGGVYYTPSYIVDYIVENTVGKLLEASTPAKVAKLRIVDPACGSGSFLLGAYRKLLDWHRDYYMDKGPGKYTKAKNVKLFDAGSGDYRLTTAEKKRILLNNIYGVDIDPQAVEVTKLSLLLKVLEGESGETLQTSLRLFKERALPDLGDNIKCGNSLIGPDFYNDMQMSLLDEEERYRINVFDWEAEFPELFGGKDPGFDVVIGNPPYVRIQHMKEWAPREVEFYKEAFRSAGKGNYDIYVVFVERSLSLVSDAGLLGFILPHKFFTATYGEELRRILTSGNHLKGIVHFGHEQVFKGSSTYTCLLFLSSSPSGRCSVTKVKNLTQWQRSGSGARESVGHESFTPSVWNLVLGDDARVMRKLSGISPLLGDLAHLFVGVQTDADDVFIVEEIGRKGDRVLCRSKATGSGHWLESQHLKPLLKGSVSVGRYVIKRLNKWLIFPYDDDSGGSSLITQQEYQSKYPLTWSYLSQNRQVLAARNKGRMGEQWWGYVYKKNHGRFRQAKLVVPSIAEGSAFASDLDGTYYFVGSGGGGGGGYGIVLSADAGISYTCLLGVLNSRLISWYLRLVSTPYRGGYIALNKQYIERLPVRVDDRECFSTMESLVLQMIQLHRGKQSSGTVHQELLLQRQIDALDRQIDQLVYELYGLSDKEIKIVEEATKR